MVKNNAVAIIINPKGEFLMQKKTLDYPLIPGQWSLFGGEIECGESSLDAMKRELMEELGLEFKNISYFSKNGWRLGGLEFKEDIFTVIFNENIENIRLSEGAGFAFFGKEELSSLNLFSEARTILEKYISKSD